MAQIAKKHSNKVYITDDNPRNEDPKKIRKTLKKYCENAYEYSSRKEAIKKAINNLSKNSNLIIAGKGHEKIQIYSNKIIKFDDVKIANFYIKKINRKK